ncbi:MULTISPECIES: MCE family protein [Gordonia]|uniref:MCE family protein n=2 Tax=Gordonia terrae TaxID=2055 RepID=A0AAD0NYT7_9ACTN|nr:MULTISPECIES: MCE family protein [Gordonia]VTR12300.1 virulence factor Mce family protein [Clostridioides difficile]ANY24835.1 virulence factor Mce [Gordonia terrae]AWO85582.1 MCE family protein [Gordonia terrae]MCG7634814.1 MCE family protein [Gordonia sp. McavH-238-E]VTS60473.1 virulence factor Mce family protein [Gordonia terrae]
MRPARLRGGLVAGAASLALIVAGCSFDGPNSLPVPGAEGTGGGSYEITALIPSAAGLVNNAPVLIDDATVGSIGDIEVEDWNALVTIRLNDGVIVPRGSHVMVGLTSALGSTHLEIVQPAEPEGGRLEAGDQIPLTKCPEQSNIVTDPSVPAVPDINAAQQVSACTYPSTEQVLSSLSVVLNGGGLSQIGDIVHEMSEVFGGREDQIKKLIPRLNTLVADLDAQKGNIIRATEGLDRLSRTMNEQSGTIERALDDSPQILQLLVDQRQQFLDTLGSVATLSKTANDILDANSEDIVTIVEGIEPALDQLQAAGPAMTQSLNILLTFPFYEPTIRRIVKGDYVNSDLTLDLTLERLDKTMFASLGVTGPEGVFGRPAGAAARGLNPFIAPLQPGGERMPDSAEPIPANMIPQMPAVTPVPAAGGGR